MTNCGCDFCRKIEKLTAEALSGKKLITKKLVMHDDNPMIFVGNSKEHFMMSARYCPKCGRKITDSTEDVVYSVKDSDELFDEVCEVGGAVMELIDIESNVNEEDCIEDCCSAEEELDNMFEVMKDYEEEIKRLKDCIVKLTCEKYGCYKDGEIEENIGE